MPDDNLHTGRFYRGGQIPLADLPNERSGSAATADGGIAHSLHEEYSRGCDGGVAGITTYNAREMGHAVIENWTTAYGSVVIRAGEAGSGWPLRRTSARPLP